MNHHGPELLLLRSQTTEGIVLILVTSMRTSPFTISLTNALHTYTHTHTPKYQGRTCWSSLFYKSLCLLRAQPRCELASVGQFYEGLEKINIVTFLKRVGVRGQVKKRFRSAGFWPGNEFLWKLLSFYQSLVCKSKPKRIEKNTSWVLW